MFKIRKYQITFYWRKMLPIISLKLVPKSALLKWLPGVPYHNGSKKITFVDNKSLAKNKKIDTKNIGPSLFIKMMAEKRENVHFAKVKDASASDNDEAEKSGNSLSSRLNVLMEKVDNVVENAQIEFEKEDRAHLDFSSVVDDNEVVGDDSVESIVFAQDIKSNLLVKPSPLFGSEDSEIPSSGVPCTGCGAELHCQHKTFPGFLPSEFYKTLTSSEMKTAICQRCHYLRHGDAFLEVTTTPESFRCMIAKIKHTRSAVVMVVDVMDISGSIVPDLMEIIGHKHPLVVVGSKADLLPPDSPGYLKHTKDQLRKTCYDAGLRNIRHVALVSAKTGFGIEKLISYMFSLYKLKAHVYIVGSANAGKSSLFNALLASDYCKNTARDLIQRATVSVWPGTTLNLLKFPIMKPSLRTLALRHKRLSQEKAKRLVQKTVQTSRKLEPQTSRTWELTDPVTTTDVRSEGDKEAEKKETAWGQEIVGYRGLLDGTIKQQDSKSLKPHFEPANYVQSYWAYDTPGLINPEQVMNMLTPEEAHFLNQATMLIPRCLVLHPYQTLFISGLSRVDYQQGDQPLLLTVFACNAIPLHVIDTQDADLFYEKSIGTHMLGIPIGSKERLQKLPSLVGQLFSLPDSCSDKNLAIADIQLSSLGWISIAKRKESAVNLRVFTPGRRGMCLRIPSLIPNHAAFRGKRIGGTAFYRTQPPGLVIAKNRGEIHEE